MTRIFRNPRGILYLSVLAILLSAMACGTAADPTAAPGAGDTAQPTTAAASGQPTATPASSTAPESPITSTEHGTVTVLVGGLGNERILPRYCNGECNTFGRLLHGYFATTTDQGGVIPSAMESWRVESGGTVWVFKLRQGAKFHDGSDVTIQDVLFSSERSVSLDEFPGAATPTQTVEGRQIVKHEITGPDEMTITFTQPYAGAAVWRSDGHAGNTRMNILPAKLLGEPYDVSEPAYEKSPIGAGPMMMVSRKPAESMSFERFEDYYYQPAYDAPEDRRPRFQFLELQLVPELSTRVSALRAGNSDLIEAAEAVAEQIRGSGGRIIYARESSYAALMLPGCWIEEVRCHDKRVVEALDLAIDRQVIADTLYTPESYSPGGWGFVTPSSLGFSPELKAADFDPGRARELMIEAGYQVPGHSEGKEFGTFEINAWDAGDFPFVPDMAQLIVESWQTELGIDARVVLTDRTLITQRWRSRELDDHIRFEVNEARWDGTTILQSRYNDPENSQRLSQDPVVLEFANAGLRVVDQESRDATINSVYLRLQEGYHHNFLPLGYANLPWGASERIVEWKPWSAAAFFNSHWTIRLAE